MGLTVTLALAGDTMLGRGVAAAIEDDPERPLLAPEVCEIVDRADLFLVNLECCVSDRGDPWPAPGKAFFFRAPPSAVRVLAGLGVACVTMANNHALDYGETALLDSLDLLRQAGIAVVGAGADVASARQAVTLEARGFRLAVVGVTDHPEDYAASPDRAGVAFADLRSGTPEWLTRAVRDAGEAAHAVLVFPHWGPNMVTRPLPYVRRAADDLLAAGATVVAGHSAHVFHGVRPPVLFDLGDFLDDYYTDRELHNDLSLLWLVTLDERGLTRVEAYPIALDYCFTRLAKADEATWITRRLRAASEPFGRSVSEEEGRLLLG